MAQSPSSTDPRIEHVIVLMLENRSFDHMLGFLSHTDPTFAGLGAGGHHNVSTSGEAIQATNDGQPDLADPDHSHDGVDLQLEGYGDVPFNGGFVRSYEQRANQNDARRVMQCLDPESRCPVLAKLAKEFAVCDAWFSSVPGETWPNRNYAHAATSDATTNIELGFYTDKTIFEQLTSRHASWRIYHDGVPQVWCFSNLWQRSLLDRLLNRGTAAISNWYEQAAFYEHVAHDDLPSYSFIEPCHSDLRDEVLQQTLVTNSQHPGNNRGSPRDFYAGERLIKDIYDALVARPALFAKSLLVITYDEHGGFYDHVKPPPATPPGDRVWRSWSRRIGMFVRGVGEWLNRRPPKPSRPFAFDRLGVRVPAVLVSPWIRPGTVVHSQLEHASIPATLRALFAPDLPSLTKRDRVAGTFHQVVRENSTPAPRPHPQGPSGPELRPLDPEHAVIPPLPELGVANVELTPELLGPDTIARPPTDFEVQLKHLSDRVDLELARDSPAIGPQRLSVRTAATNEPAIVEAPASVADRFAAAAAAARKGRGGN